VWRHCQDKGTRGRTVTLKVKFADFEIIFRSQSLPDLVSDREQPERVSIGLLRNLLPVPKAVRLLGVALSSFHERVELYESQLAFSL
jgi:DNA polymerase IV